MPRVSEDMKPWKLLPWLNDHAQFLLLGVDYRNPGAGGQWAYVRLPEQRVYHCGD